MSHAPISPSRWIQRLAVAISLLGTIMASGSVPAATMPPGVDVYQAVIGSNTIGPAAAGPDGNLWFIEYAPKGTRFATTVAKIGRITPTGAVSDFALPALDRTVKPTYDENFAAIAAGPDGGVWFTDAPASSIGRIAPNGTIAEFAVPTPHSGLGEIAAGPDGNIWFLEEIGYTPGAPGPTPLRSKIVRMATDGTATEFETEGELRNLIAGPDGNLYTMNRSTQTLLRISPAGAITSLPTGYVNAYQIIVGSDGNLWGAQWSSCRPTPCQYLYRVTTAGAVTQFNAPTPPSGIAMGRDGALWFISFSSPQLGRMTTTGTFNAYALPAGVGDAQFIAAGPDGNLWITTASNAIIHWDPTAVVSLATSPGANATPSATSNTPAATCAPFAPNSAFATAGFQSQWQQGEAITPNFWGPAVTDGHQEPYAEATGSQRFVQYFDKGRMDLTDVTTGTVTNGLLATELITGRVQLGNNAFQDQAPPAIPMAGDPTNPGPTYAQLKANAGQLLVPVSSLLSSSTEGAPVTVMFGVSGEVTPFAEGANYPAANIALYDATTQHNVPRAFAGYRQRVGLSTFGLAISEPFWSNPKVGARNLLVLVQAFERRVLTYTPVNEPAYQIEMGNIGQHYYRWRYCSS